MKPVTDPALLAQLNGGSSPSGGTPSSGTPVTDPDVLAQLEGNAPAGTKAPGWLQAIAHVIKAPGEALRGQAIGIEQLIAHPTEPAMAPVMAALAQRSNYKPQGVGENLATFASGFNDPVNKVMGGMFPGGSMVKSILGGGASSAITNGLDQAVNTGKIDLGQTLQAGEEGAATGGAIHGAVAGIRSGTNKLVENAPAIFETLAKIPKRATAIFTKNPDIMKDVPGNAQAIEENIETKAAEVPKALAGLMEKKREIYNKVAEKLGIHDKTDDLAVSKELPPQKIVGDFNAMRQELEPFLAQYEKAKASGMSPEELNKKYVEPNKEVLSDRFKDLLNIRGSIGFHVKQKPGSGVPPLYKPAEKGLLAKRAEVNALIERLPGGEIIRDADAQVGPIKDLYKKLHGNMERPGENVAWLKKVFNQEGPNAKEDALLLASLEKMSGQPVVEDFYRAMTQGAFAPKLADNQIKRSLAGASPFLISALLRTVGVPFQFSLPISATIASGGQSPAALGGALRWAQNAEPSIQKVAKGSAVAGLNAIRQLMGATQ